jgi:hypothetical protein
VSIRIFQGKNRREEESTLLGEFEFSGFKKAKAGEVALEVLFSINPDGIVEVNATDNETKKTQGVKVKLSTALDSQKLSEAKKKAVEHREVQLKNEFKDAQRIFFCLPSPGGAVYEEGYIRGLNPMDKQFVILSEQAKGAEKKIDRSKVSWFATIEDFANIPRYIQALTTRPEKFLNPLRSQFYQFRMKNGTDVFGQADLPKLSDQGFWITPYFSSDELPGKVYIYSANVEEARPINV